MACPVPTMNTQPTVLAGTSDRKVIRLQIPGKVQGVYYRALVVDAARRLRGDRVGAQAQ